MFIEKRKFKNSKGLTLSAIYEGEDRSAPVVVMCHGFGSSKNSESNSDLAQKLANAGLCVYRFDFTGHGESEGQLENCTPNQGLDDLKSAIKNLNREKFALYGSSYGGFISLVYASKNPILALGLKAPVSQYWDVGVTKSEENLGFTQKKKENFLKELESIDIYNLAKKVTVPVLIAHGSADEVVPITQSQKLMESLGGEKRLVIIHNAAHIMRGSFMQDAHSQLAEFFVSELL